MKRLRLPILATRRPLFPGQLALPPESISELDPHLEPGWEYHHLVGVIHSTGPQCHHLASVGTLARFVDVDDLWGEIADRPLLVGTARFRLVQIYHDHDYLEGTIELWPWEETPEPPWDLVETVGVYLRRYTEASAELMPPPLFPDVLPMRSATLGILAAAALELPSEEKQRLLELPTAHALLEAMLKHLRLHAPMAERLAAMTPQTQAAYETLQLN